MAPTHGLNGRARGLARTFVDDVRVGDVGAGHADHVELAFGNGMARGRDVGDARDAWNTGNRVSGLHLACEVEMRRGGHALDRDDFRRARHRVSMWPRMMLRKSTLPEEARRCGDLHALVACSEPCVPVLVRHHADADDEIPADRVAHRVEYAPGEAQAVVERTAIVTRQRWLVAGDQKPSMKWP